VTDIQEKRRAQRISVNLPTVVEGVGQPPMQLHDNLARVYERVTCSEVAIGKRFPAAVRDLSSNGAFLAGDAIPLLSRVCFKFELPRLGGVEVLGWTMWRRSEDCELPRAEGRVVLPRGFGVLFEAIPLEARQAIQQMVQASVSPR
jgi:hypothetical protein